MKVINRSDGNVAYSLPEMNMRRVFTPWETKDVSAEELEALYATDGGADLIKGYLLIDDEKWVNQHFDAPIEYFWKEEEIKKCILEDPLDLFEETLDYAPDGVIDLIKYYSWTIPLTDLNKIKVLQDKTGFDTLGSIEVMKGPDGETAPTPHERRRKREA